MAITAQVEHVMDVLEDLMPTLFAHWKDVGLFRDKMPLDPDYPRYARADAANEYLMVTARDDGRIIGYVSFWVHGPPHYHSTITAFMDLIYLPQDHRGLGIGRMMVDIAKPALKAMGVGPMWVGSKDHKSIDGFWAVLGFEPGETLRVAWIGD